MKDRTSLFQLKRAISPVSVSDNTAMVGQVIDRQGYMALSYVLAIGAITDADATFTVLLEEATKADFSDAVAVVDQDMISQSPGVLPETVASFRFDSDDQVRKLGYVGDKRYTRLTVTPANNAGAAVVAAMAILSLPDRSPVEQAAA